MKEPCYTHTHHKPSRIKRRRNREGWRGRKSERRRRRERRKRENPTSCLPDLAM